jgi:hypothetical protein
MKKPANCRKSTQFYLHPRLECLEERLTPTTYTVSSLADSGDGSLRAAIASSNADPADTADEINFSITGVIKLTSGALPTIANTVKIDGRSAPGFAKVPLVEIDNNGFAGLTLKGANSLLAGLSIINANGAGVTLVGQFNDQNLPGPGQFIGVVGNYIGIALDGSVAGNTGYGLEILNSSSIIGGTSVADRNIISGNGTGGIRIEDRASGLPVSYPHGALIVGNFIGTDPSGQVPAPNHGNGITIVNPGSAVGSVDPEGSNTIAFNTLAGIQMPPGCEVIGNSIFGNGSKGIDIDGTPFNNAVNSQVLSTPQLSYAIESSGETPGFAQVQIGGVLNTHYKFFIIDCTIQLYATLNGMPAGQGQIFLGSTVVRTDNNGFAKFTVRNLSVPVGPGTIFTATATVPYFGGAFRNTSEFSAAIQTGGSGNNLFLASAYSLLLNRYPESSAVYWVNLLNNGASPQGVVLGIESSPEYLSSQVTALYQRYLQRDSEAAGNLAWTNFLLAGGTLEQLVAGLTGSQEYFVRSGGNNRAFLSHLYLDLLNREASVNELTAWELALVAGVPRTNVTGAFVTSQEYRGDLLQANYQTFLKRPTDSEAVLFWTNAMNTGATDQQVLAQIFGSPEGYQLWS